MGTEQWEGYAPIFSILIPVWHPDPAHLRACLESVLAQTTADWEVCLVIDGPQPPDVDRCLPPDGPILGGGAFDDDRIRVHRRPTNGGIAAATDDALRMARGQFVALLDNDDTLAPEALGTVAWEIEAHDPGPEGRHPVDVVFSDEDHLDFVTDERINPFYKPGFSMERLRQQMYFGHLMVFRRTLALEVGGFRPGFDGSQDHDLTLRAVERARTVLHIPKLLYHWRESPTSTAMDAGAKDWAYEAGVRAVASHLERTGFPATASRNPDWPGIIDLTPKLTERPRVSIIIPTGGTRRTVQGSDRLLVAEAIRSIVERTDYVDYELVVVLDRNAPADLAEQIRDAAAGREPAAGRDPAGGRDTAAGREPAAGRDTANAGREVVIIADDRPFNFAAACNLGAVRATGDVLLFLNDDTEISMPEWLERMVMYATRPDIGAVGVKMLYGDGRIQHAGTWSRWGSPAHRYVGYRSDHPGYLAALATAQNCVAVTAACLAVERDKFEQVGGMSTIFPLAYNDVDLCLKLSRSGYRTVVDCATEVIHHESSSRDPSVEDWEFEALQRRWGPVLANDPYDNPNHTAPRVEEYPPTSTFLVDLRAHGDGPDHRARAWPSPRIELRC